MVEISVLIISKNRAEKLFRCLNSIQQNSYQNFEMVVVDQSPNHKTKNLVKKFFSERVKYLRLLSGGKSKGLNLGLSVCRGQIIAFTDDDCLVEPDWLKRIVTFFKKNQAVAGVFGQSLPYGPDTHPHQVCAATFRSQKRRYFRHHQIIHYKQLGLGNNMAFRKEVFKKAGLFKEWLGPGVSGMAGGEEAEFIYRTLKSGFLLAFEPGIIIYHDNWLSYHDEQILQGRYSIGAMAFYSYYLPHDFGLFIGRIVDRFSERILYLTNHIVRDLITFRLKKLYQELLYFFWESICFSRGFIVGFYQLIK